MRQRINQKTAVDFNAETQSSTEGKWIVVKRVLNARQTLKLHLCFQHEMPDVLRRSFTRR